MAGRNNRAGKGGKGQNEKGKEAIPNADIDQNGGGAARDENGYLLKPTETVASAKEKIDALVTARAGYDNTSERIMKYQEFILNAPKANARELYDYYTKREKERSRKADEINRETVKKIIKEGGGDFFGRALAGNSLNRRNQEGGEFRNLPQYLTPTNVSKAQQRKLINYLAEKPLKELRQNQGLIESQIGLLAKNTSFSTEQKTRIATDLQMKQRFYNAAVDRRVFDLGKKD